MSEAIDAMQKLTRRRGPSCWYAILDDAELRSSIDEAIGRHDIASSVVAIWLKSKGVQVNQHSVARHRRNDCACSND